MPNNYIRVHNRKDTDAKWSYFNPKLLDGEVIIVSVNGSIRFKVGDGVAHYNDLPFLNDEIIKQIDDINGAMKDRFHKIEESVEDRFSDLEDHTNESLSEFRDDINQLMEKKLDASTSPDNVGKILAVNSKGFIELMNLDISGQNVTLSSVIGLSEILKSKAEKDSVDELSDTVDEISASVDRLSENMSNMKIESIQGLKEALGDKIDRSDLEEINEALKDKADNSEIDEINKSLEDKVSISEFEELSKKVEDIKVEAPTDITINDIPGLSDILQDKADDTEVKEIVDNIDTLNDKISVIEESLDDKLPTKLPTTESGKVLYIDEYGNIIPKEIQFSSGGGTGSGPITWGDLIGVKG